MADVPQDVTEAAPDGEENPVVEATGGQEDIQSPANAEEAEPANAKQTPDGNESAEAAEAGEPEVTEEAQTEDVTDVDAADADSGSNGDPDSKMADANAETPESEDTSGGNDAEEKPEEEEGEPAKEEPDVVDVEPTGTDESEPSAGEEPPTTDNANTGEPEEDATIEPAEDASTEQTEGASTEQAEGATEQAEDAGAEQAADAEDANEEGDESGTPEDTAEAVDVANEGTTQDDKAIEEARDADAGNEAEAMESLETTEKTSSEDTSEAAGEEREASEEITEQQSTEPSPQGTEVRIITVKSGDKDIKVEIHPPTIKKPFLGGWRNKNTGVEYHNGSTQTYKRTRASDGKEKFHRVTQTQELSSGQTNTQQTDRETSTQMTFTGVYVTTKTDKTMTPKNYETAADRLIRLTNHVIVIQKWYRRWSATKYVGALRDQRRMLREWQFSEQERKTEEVEAEHHSKIMRRLNPKTKEDFDLLYAGLEAWHKEQQEKINQMDSLERKAAKVMLLKQETNYLASIDRLKQAANSRNRERRVAKFLDEAAAPKEWVDPMYEKVNTMETPATIRARELKEVYNTFKQWDVSTDARLDALVKVKGIVQDYKTKLTKDIIGLLNREADLLMRGTKPKNLEGLRKRSLNLFLQFVETPEFNPEAARLLQVHKKPEELQKDVFLCRGCGRYHPATEFEVSPLMKTMGKCKQCMKMANYATKREDKTQIRRILDDVRLNELAFNDFSQTAFLMTTDDVKLLVQSVWGAKSALSQHNDITDLRLIRWDSSREFAPDNCILLTKDEAASHSALTTLEGTYGRNFVAKIHQRHIQGRNKFSRLMAQSSIARKKAIEKKRAMEAMATGKA